MRLKALCTAVLLVYFTCTSQAQVVFTGPTTVAPLEMTTINLSQVDGNDLKLQVFDNGVLTSKDYAIAKGLNDQFSISVFVSKPKTLTFVAGVNKDNKTYITNHVLTVTGPTPTPDPNPTPTDLQTKLTAAYKTSPDPASLGKLVSIFDEVSNGKYKTFDDMQTVLANTTKKVLKDSDLRKVRDTISEHLVSKLGTDSRRVDVDKATSVFKDVVAALKKVS